MNPTSLFNDTLAKLSGFANYILNFVVTSILPPSPYFWFELGAFAVILVLQFKTWKNKESQFRTDGSREFVVFLSFIGYVVNSLAYAVIWPLGLSYLLARDNKAVLEKAPKKD